MGWRLDWRRFRIHLTETYGVAVAYLFIGYLAKHEPLYCSLQSAGFRIIFKPTFELPDGTIKGNVDAELVLQAMIDYDNYNKAVIVSGDGDFHCLVKYLNEQGKLHCLLVPNAKKYSRLLKPFAKDKLDFMNNLRGKLTYPKGS